MKRISFLLWITLTGGIVFGQPGTGKKVGSPASVNTKKPMVLADNELMSMANAATPGMASYAKTGYTNTLTPTQPVSVNPKNTQPKTIEPTYLDQYLAKQSGPQHCQIYYATINVYHIWENTLGDVIYNKLLEQARKIAFGAMPDDLAKQIAAETTADAQKQLANNPTSTWLNVGTVVSMPGVKMNVEFTLTDFNFAPMKYYVTSPGYTGAKAQFTFDYLEPANFGLDAINNKLLNYTDVDGTPSAKTFSAAYTLKTTTLTIHP